MTPLAFYLFLYFFGMTVYTYLGYPILLFLINRFLHPKVAKKEITPSVSIILSAFNEEKYIERKLHNLLQLDYPLESLEIIVGSDGGSDTTDQIISKFRSPQIRFFRFIANRGKPEVLNTLVQEAHGEILLFTDARQELDPMSLRELVANFHDAKVGCVSGELLFKDIRTGNIGKGMDAYWKYEKWLRRNESRLSSMLGATGAIYAIRRQLFSPLPGTILVDDMYLPLTIIQKGYRAIFESQAHAYDHTSSKGKEESKRKVRTLAGNYQIFELFPALLNPLKSRIAWQLLSHKFLRLMVPFFLVGIFICNLLLMANKIFAWFFILQMIFYGLAFIEGARETLHMQRTHEGKPRKRTIGYIPYTFCLLNYAAMKGLIQYATQNTSATWEKAYS